MSSARGLSALRCLLMSGLALAGACVASSTTNVPAPATANVATSPDRPPALDRIREDEIRRDLFQLAGDAMRGREAGTLDELRASVWVAERAREAGLLPAGEDGSYFQWWPMRRVRTGQGSTISLGGQPLALWRDVIVASPTAGSVTDAPLIYVGEGRDADLAGQDITGKAVVALLSAPTPLPTVNVSLRGYRYTIAAVRQRAAFLLQKGASAVVLVSDSIAESEFERAGTILGRGRYNVDSASAGAIVTQPPVLWVRRAMLEQLRSARPRLSASLGAVRVARCGGARAPGLALVRGASDGAAFVDRGGAQRRHDRTQRPGQCGAARLAAAPPEFVRAGGHGARGKRQCLTRRDRQLVGPADPSRRVVFPERPPALRAGRVPALFFTTLLHPDYHTPRDEPDRIDVAKVARVARWMYATGWMVSETPDRPALDGGFKLER